MSTTPTRPTTSRMRRAVGALLALAVSGLGFAAGAGTAAATEIEAITGVAITQPMAGVKVGTSVRVDATWSAAGAHADDTFTLRLPTSPGLEGVARTFDLTDPAGAVVGSCAVGAAAITCTLNDYVTTHTDVSGSLYFWAVALDESSDGKVIFGTEGGPIAVTVPGGAIGPRDSMAWPDDAMKDGRIDEARGLIEWSVIVPGAKLREAGESPIVVTDAFDSRLGALVATPKIYWVTEAQWLSPDPWNFDQFLGAADFTYADGDAPNEFTLRLNPASIEANRLYIIQYKTPLPADAEGGDAWTNTATGRTWEAAKRLQFQGAGGAGDGDRLRAITVTTEVNCACECAPAPDATFLVDYSYPGRGGRAGHAGAGTLEVSAAAPATLPGLAPGTVVTLTQRTPDPLECGTWQPAVFSVDGEPAGATATVTVGGHADSIVTITNSLACADAPTGPPSTPPTATPPTATPPTATPPTATPPGDLAITGAEISILLAVIVGLCIAGGALLLVQRLGRGD